MHIDRATKYLLALIAAGLWVQTLGQVGLPQLTAKAEASVAASHGGALQAPEKPDGGKGTARAATATLPLRWSVPYATERSVNTTHCGTAIIVTNATDSSVVVEVEWFRYYSASLALLPLLVAGNYQRIWISGGYASDPDTDSSPFNPDVRSALSDFLGYARVHADDPRIQVAAFQYCRDAQGTGKNIVSITNIPAYPVGATMEYFQAGMPATWTPPMAVPELPE